jgi:hypothetical protein
MLMASCLFLPNTGQPISESGGVLPFAGSGKNRRCYVFNFYFYNRTKVYKIGKVYFGTH